MASQNNDMNVLKNIGYGLYVVTSNDGVKDNGCIVNSVMQITSNPVKIAVAINKENYSHGVIKNSGIMNVNLLSEEAPFKVFEVFGFASGRDTDKFESCSPNRSENGLAVLPRYINSYMSLKVEEYYDFGSHGMFVCTPTEAEVISDVPSMTYAYYHANVKPGAKAKAAKGYVCTICGYVHDEAELPADFECPLCKHGVEFFEPIE